MSRDFFWDLERSEQSHRGAGNQSGRSTCRAAIHSMLVDHMLLSNIEPVPAGGTASPQDRWISSSPAPCRIGSRCRLCAEFKSAHSAELVSGLTDQLRHYMDATGTGNGAYCVLDFRGRDFALPAGDHRAVARPAARGRCRHAGRKATSRESALVQAGRGVTMGRSFDNVDFKVAEAEYSSSNV